MSRAPASDCACLVASVSDSRAAPRPSSVNFSMLERESLAKYENWSIAASLAALNWSILIMVFVLVGSVEGAAPYCCAAQWSMLRRSPMASRGLANYFVAVHHPAQAAAKGLAPQGFRGDRPEGGRPMAGRPGGQRVGSESPCALMRWSMHGVLPFRAGGAVPPISPAGLGELSPRGAPGPRVPNLSPTQPAP